MAGCTASPGATAHGTATADGTATPAGVVSDCLLAPVSCYAPALFRVEYDIQPLLDKGIDGCGETVTVVAVAPPPGAPSPSAPSPGAPSPGAPSPGATAGPPPGVSAASDIRQDLAAFDGMFRLPAARVQVVTALAGAGSPWQAADEEVQDAEIVHAVAPAAALRVVLLPADAVDSAANATAGMLAGLRLAVSGTDVALISFSLGEHYFTMAQVTQLNSLLAGAAARHVTVIAGSGDNGGFSQADFGDTAVKEVSLPASGTSAAASLWGGLMALADQYAQHDLGFVNPAIYRIARSSSYHQAFHDVTTGSNIVNMPYPAAGMAGYQAGPGWSPVTGWGTPDAQLLVPLLAA